MYIYIYIFFWQQQQLLSGLQEANSFKVLPCGCVRAQTKNKNRKNVTGKVGVTLFLAVFGFKWAGNLNGFKEFHGL